MNLNGTIFNPGDLRTSIVIKKKTVTTDAGGFKVETWATVVTVLSKWINAHGSEVLTADMAGVQAFATVTIRYRSDVDESYAVEKGNVLWEIVSVDNIRERN